MRIIAHRGASAYEPENTMRAFERALELGADWCELDVQVTRDGVAVVSHSDDLSEATDGRGHISASTLVEVRACDAGRGERIPTLAEVVESFRGRLGLYIELKAPGSATATSTVLRASAAIDGLVLGSFDQALVRQAGALGPGVPTSVLMSETDVDLVAVGRRCGATLLHPCWGDAAVEPHTLVPEAFVAKLNRAGFGVVIWHEERPAELRHLALLPVWGICTNAPDVLAQVVASTAL